VVGNSILKVVEVRVKHPFIHM